MSGQEWTYSCHYYGNRQIFPKLPFQHGLYVYYTVILALHWPAVKSILKCAELNTQGADTVSEVK